KLLVAKIKTIVYYGNYGISIPCILSPDRSNVDSIKIPACFTVSKFRIIKDLHIIKEEFVPDQESVRVKFLLYINFKGCSLPFRNFYLQPINDAVYVNYFVFLLRIFLLQFMCK